MSAASAVAAPGDASAPAVAKKSRKKLILVIVAVLVVLALAAGGAVFVLKKRAAAAAAEAGEETESAGAHASEGVDRAHPPTFVPLDAFVVNLADKDADRYAQIGVTLEIDDAKFADQIKLYMPAIRNGVLMVLADKTSRDLLDRSGKEALAAEILRAAVKPLGLAVDEPEAPAKARPKAHDGEAVDEAEAETAPKPKAKARAAKPAEHNPVRRVHFSNFIVQ
jgi:flagellar FliL protein